MQNNFLKKELIMARSVIRSKLFEISPNIGNEIDDPEDFENYKDLINHDKLNYSPRISDLKYKYIEFGNTSPLPSTLSYSEDLIITPFISENSISVSLFNHNLSMHYLGNRAPLDNSTNRKRLLTYSNEKFGDISFQLSKRLKIPRKALVFELVSSISFQTLINIENKNANNLNLKDNNEEVKSIEQKPAPIDVGTITETQVYECTVCHGKFQCRQSLGGHMSRKHKKLSLIYQEKKTIRMNRKEQRTLNLISKIEYFHQKNLNFLELDKTHEGKKKIRENLNRNELKSIKNRLLDEKSSVIAQFQKDYPSIYQGI